MLNNERLKAFSRKIYSFIMLPDFKLYYKAIVIKIVWYQHTKTDTQAMEHSRDPIEINPHIYGQVLTIKEPRIYSEERMASSIKWCHSFLRPHGLYHQALRPWRFSR